MARSPTSARIMSSCSDTELINACTISSSSKSKTSPHSNERRLSGVYVAHACPIDDRICSTHSPGERSSFFFSQSEISQPSLSRPALPHARRSEWPGVEDAPHLEGEDR